MAPSNKIIFCQSMSQYSISALFDFHCDLVHGPLEYPSARRTGSIMSGSWEMLKSAKASEIINLDDSAVSEQSSNPEIICLDDSANQSRTDIPEENVTQFHRVRAEVDLTSELTRIKDYSDKLIVIPAEASHGKRKSDDEFDTVQKVRKVNGSPVKTVTACNETVTIEDDSCIDCDIILSLSSSEDSENSGIQPEKETRSNSEIIATCSNVNQIGISNNASTAATSLSNSQDKALNPAVRFSPYTSIFKRCEATHELLRSGKVETFDVEREKKKKKKKKRKKPEIEENTLNDSDCLVIENDTQNSKSKIKSLPKRTLVNSNLIPAGSDIFLKPLSKIVSSTSTKFSDSTFPTTKSSCDGINNLLVQDKIPLNCSKDDKSVQNDEDIIVVLDDAALQKEKADALKIGKNVSIPTENISWKGLRPVIIDGSNVAFSHGLSTLGERKFSCKGIEICINYFKERGHKVITFVPLFRKSNPYTVQAEILVKLAEQGQITFTPSRRVNSKLSVPYDDRYIVQCAVAMGGVIVSSDNYRDLLDENEAWRSTIENRLLMFTFIGDMLMFPQDPLGRSGPNLEEFLRFPDE